jgi:thymidylate synthase
MNGEINYLDILNKILNKGERKENRTGIDTFAIPPVVLQHDMSRGFPLMTTKKVPFKLIASELEFFIKGLTDKEWLQERNNHIWDEWASPYSVESYMKYTGETDIKKAQLEVTELGPVYGAQWRNFNYGAVEDSSVVADGSADQLKIIVDNLHSNPNDRRMVCSAWNPLQLKNQALPPCHLLWNVNHINGKLHLTWHQRSCDMFLGVPFNLASYALLLHLLCKEANMEPGTVTGTLVDCHIYENHLDQVKEQLSRTPYEMPKIKTEDFTNIFDWKCSDTSVIGYNSHKAIKGEVAV